MTEEHINETVTQKNIKEVGFHYKDQQFISIRSRLSKPFIHVFFLDIENSRYVSHDAMV